MASDAVARCTLPFDTLSPPGREETRTPARPTQPSHGRAPRDERSDGPDGAPSIAARQGWLAAFARRLRHAHADLVAVVGEEIGKPVWETSLAEVLPLLASIDWHRRHLARLLGARSLGRGPWWQWGTSGRVHRLPLGRVLIIATWNYPLQLLGIQLVQSMAAGNETWVKPSERSPRSQRLLLDLARAALADAGLSQDLLVECDAARAEGERLLREERFDHILFTGSTTVGRRVAEAAAVTLTPTTLELSGRDSAIILADADPDLAARSLWQATCLNAGQTCMAPRRALVDRRLLPAFLDALRPLAAAARPLRLVDADAAARCHACVEDAIARGGRSISGVLEAPAGAWYRPMVVADCPLACELADGAHFGPALAVIAADGVADMLAMHRTNGQVLATSVFTRTPSAVEAMLADLESSFVTVNECIRPTAHPAASILGRGASGWGASRGEAGLLALTRAVTVTRRGWGSPPPEPPTERVLGLLRRMAGLGPVRDARQGTNP